MANNIPTVQIPSDVINPIIEAAVSEAVIRALGNSEQVLTRAISSVLNIQVDESGKVGNYNTKPWLSWAIGNAVRDAAEKAIVEHLAQHGELIKKQMAKELANSKSPLAQQLIAGMVGALTHPDCLRYRIKVEFDQR